LVEASDEAGFDGAQPSQELGDVIDRHRFEP
jgi:hypothetical protein